MNAPSLRPLRTLLPLFPLLTGLLASCISLPAGAEATPAELALLGKTLTPMGAEKAGNAAGTIPAWDGGYTKVPADHKTGGHYSDPFAGEKPLFAISAGNLAQYQANLTPGQSALLKKYPNLKFNVYPSHRTAAFPKAINEETVTNAAKARLSNNGNGVEGASGGVPFPIPHNGQEAIWNHILQYRGDTFAMNMAQVTPTRSGEYTLQRMEFEYDFHYGNQSKPAKEKRPNLQAHFIQNFTAPPTLAGTVLLIHETIDQIKEPRSTWAYAVGARRVRLAPEVAYDNPAGSADGLRTNDDFWMYNGAIDRYDWKLVGKKELYVPYNAYPLISNKLKYSDLVRPGHLNPEVLRYELHRVWVVEATLKPEYRHIYAKRVFYLDEDSWRILAIDKYDARGELWRVAESHTIEMYDIPMNLNMVDVQYDLQNGRYLAMGLRNEEPFIYRPLKRTNADYTPSALRNIGQR